MVSEKLQTLQNFLGEDIIQNPRNQGYAFAFDLPEKDWVPALVSKRFPNGLLFYPAGSNTLRFRLLVNTTEQELNETLTHLVQCFQELKTDGLIKKELPSMNDWALQLSGEAPRKAQESQDLDFPWSPFTTRTPVEKWKEAQVDWAKVFSSILNRFPQLLFSEQTPPLEELDADELVQKYKETSSFTKLDLLFALSRSLGTKVLLADEAKIKQHEGDITTLEENTYEKERRATVDEFVEIANLAKGSVLIALSENEKLQAICASTPASKAEKVPLIDTENYVSDVDALYSFDLTVSQEAQGKKLGLRLKAEQLIRARQNGFSRLRSRNRHPESYAMERLNFKLGHVLYLKNHEQYDGKSPAHYQSLSYSKGSLPIGDRKEGSLKNKLTLSNFITEDYANSLKCIEQFYPQELRHFFIGSGRSETLDKMIRLLRFFNPQGTYCISLKGSYFGESTAASRSIGGPSRAKYFNWPIVEKAKELDQYFSENDPASCLAFFVEVKEGICNESELNAFSEVVQKHKVPVILTSAEPPKSGWPCDGHILFGGGQLGLLAVKENFFLDKPLQMISTWEGDEWSLHLYKEKLIHGDTQK